MSDNFDAGLPQASQDGSVQLEKTLPQSEVNKIAAHVRAEAYEKGRQEAFAQAQATISPGLSEEQARHIAQQEFQRQQQELSSQMQKKQAETYAEQIIGDFESKMKPGIEKYEDFTDKVKELQLVNMPALIPYITGAEHPAEVMYELANNPSKIGSLLALHNQGLGHLARAEIGKLSKSIDANLNAAQNVRTPQEPLSQVKPSKIAGEALESIHSLRRKSYLKG